LQEHFSLTNPHIHLNSISHAHDERHVHRQKKRKSLPISTHIGIAASLLFALAIIWYFKNGNRLQNEPVIAAEVTSNIPRITHEDGAAQGNVTPAKDLQESQSEGAPDSRRPNNNGVVKPLIVAAEPPAGSEKAKLQETTVKDTRNPAEEPQKPMALASAVANMPAKTVKNGKTNPSNDVSTTLVSKRADEAAEKVAEPAYKVDKVEIGDDLYRQHKFDKALVAYRQAMKTENAEIRAEAAFKAAKCHLELGEQDKAILLLNDLASGDGPQQKQAKKLLRKIK
jgi:tetratricopeptide (TPR) repeat protein